MTDVPGDPIAIDVGQVLGEVLSDVRRSVTSLYSSLVTRPTGRAVRRAIQLQVEGAGIVSLSLIDFSEVSIIDFSCADEVVAKLLQEYLDDGPRDAYFVFSGVHEPHRDQIETVLKRQALAAVVETRPGVFSLLGAQSLDEARVWGLLEACGAIEAPDMDVLLPLAEDRDVLMGLVRRRLAFRSPTSGRVHALSRLVHHLL
jgi:hypothetical protein